MNTEVEPDDPGVECGSINVGKETIVQCGNMMIPMQEHQWAFSQHDEDGITEFGNFGTAEQESPQTGSANEEVTIFAIRI
jgi:hypothetical protein